jgi:hypothetical protein
VLCCDLDRQPAIGLPLRAQATEGQRQELLPRVAEQTHHARIRVEDAARVDVVGDDRLRRELEVQSKALLAEPELLLGELSRGSVASLAKRALDRRDEPQRLVLREEVERTRTQRIDRRLLTRCPRDHDAWKLGLSRLHELECLLSAEAREQPVRRQQVPWLVERASKRSRIGHALARDRVPASA